MLGHASSLKVAMVAMVHLNHQNYEFKLRNKSLFILTFDAMSSPRPSFPLANFRLTQPLSGPEPQSFTKRKRVPPSPSLSSAWTKRPVPHLCWITVIRNNRHNQCQKKKACFHGSCNQLLLIQWEIIVLPS